MEARVARAVLCCLAVLAGVVVGTTVAIGATATAEQSVDRQFDGTDPSERIDGGAFNGATLEPSLSAREGRTAVGTGPAVDRQNETDGGGNESSDETAGNETTENDTRIEGYDEVHVEIALQGQNGTATWTVQYRYRLDSENGSAVWSGLRSDVEERPDAYVERFEERWSDQIERASDEADREMELSDFDVTTENASGVQEYGFVTFTFRWSAFARVELNAVEAGDALEGFVLDDRTQLVVTWPEAYNATAVEPEPDESRETTVIWHGSETEFVEGEPRIELLRDDGESTAATQESDGGLPLPWLAALGLAFLAAVGAVGWWARGDRTAAAPGGGSDGPAESRAEPAGGENGGGPPRELLSNEERVLRLLEEHGGRIKQQAVVSELNWTEAKTSQVVGDLREAGEIEVFRIGRENVLALPEGKRRPRAETDENEAAE